MMDFIARTDSVPLFFHEPAGILEYNFTQSTRAPHTIGTPQSLNIPLIIHIITIKSKIKINNAVYDVYLKNINKAVY